MMYSIVSMCALLLVATTANAESALGHTSAHRSFIEQIMPEAQSKIVLDAFSLQQTSDLGPFLACVLGMGEPPAVCEGDGVCKDAATFNTCANYAAGVFACLPLMPVDPDAPVDPYTPDFANMSPEAVTSILASGCIKDFGGNYCGDVVPGEPADYANPAVTHTCDEAAQYGCCLEVAFDSYNVAGVASSTATSFPGCTIVPACPSGGETSTVVKGTVAIDCLSSSYMTMQESQMATGYTYMMAADMIMGALERDIARIADVAADNVYVTAWNKTALNVVYFDYTVGGIVAQIEDKVVTTLTNSSNWSFPEMEAEGVIQSNTFYMYSCSSDTYSYEASATVAPATAEFVAPVAYSAAGVVVPSLFMLLLAVAAVVMA